MERALHTLLREGGPEAYGGLRVRIPDDGWRVLADPEGNEFCAKQPA